MWNTKPSITDSTKPQAYDSYLWFYTDGLWGTAKVFYPIFIHFIMNSCPKRICAAAGDAVRFTLGIWRRHRGFSVAQQESSWSRRLLGRSRKEPHSSLGPAMNTHHPNRLFNGWWCRYQCIYRGGRQEYSHNIYISLNYNFAFYEEKMRWVVAMQLLGHYWCLRGSGRSLACYYVVAKVFWMIARA